MLKLVSSVSHCREIASAVRCSELKAKQTDKIIKIRASLVANGFKTLTSQARALGLLRSTAWNLLSGHHKASGLSASIIKRILSSSELPDATRKVVEEYVEEKLKGTYGHDRAALRRFSQAAEFSGTGVTGTPPLDGPLVRARKKPRQPIER